MEVGGAGAAGLLPGGKPLPLPEPDSPPGMPPAQKEPTPAKILVGSAVSGGLSPACSSPEPYPWLDPGPARRSVWGSCWWPYSRRDRLNV